MGGGFYDRAFAENKHLQDEVTKPLLIGVAYDIQQTASVLPDWWDVPLDVIVTETRILRRRPSSQ
jgi:5-formyltetrahydrofolate cyclo-ligase